MESGILALLIFIAYLIGIIVGKNWDILTNDEPKTKENK